MDKNNWPLPSLEAQRTHLLARYGARRPPVRWIVILVSSVIVALIVSYIAANQIGGRSAFIHYSAYAAPALETLPDFSAWRKCGETEQPWFFHRRFENHSQTVFWLASVFFENSAAAQPSFAAVVRAELKIGRPSDITVELFSFVKEDTGQSLKGVDVLGLTGGQSVPVWPVDSDLGRRFVAWLVARGEPQSFAAREVPSYRLSRQLSGNLAQISFGFERSALSFSDTTDRSYFGFLCL